jgi:hypothetical protein
MSLPGSFGIASSKRILPRRCVVTDDLHDQLWLLEQESIANHSLYRWE